MWNYTPAVFHFSSAVVLQPFTLFNMKCIFSFFLFFSFIQWLKLSLIFYPPSEGETLPEVTEADSGVWWKWSSCSCSGKWVCFQVNWMSDEARCVFCVFLYCVYWTFCLHIFSLNCKSWSDPWSWNKGGEWEKLDGGMLCTFGTHSKKGFRAARKRLYLSLSISFHGIAIGHNSCSL